MKQRDNIIGFFASQTTNQAITIVGNNGEFSGTLSPGQAVWYRAYYGNPGADMTITARQSESSDNRNNDSDGGLT